MSTELGEAGVAGIGIRREIMASMVITVDESCDDMMKMLATTSEDKYGGKMVLYIGETAAWCDRAPCGLYCVYFIPHNF